VTKKELVRRIALDLKIDQVLTKCIVQKTLDGVLSALVSEGRVELRNFGVFEVKARAARKARNPKTNVELVVPAKHVLVFQPGKNVADMIANLDKTPTPPPTKP
jgi:nucleoid DNA-binding protein